MKVMLLWEQLWVALLVSVLSTGHADTKRVKENNQNKYRANTYLPPYTSPYVPPPPPPAPTTRPPYVPPAPTVTRPTYTRPPPPYVPPLIPLKPHIRKRRNAL